MVSKQSCGSDIRHPDAAAYLKGLSSQDSRGASVVRSNADGSVSCYQLAAGEVQAAHVRSSSDGGPAHRPVAGRRASDEAARDEDLYEVLMSAEPDPDHVECRLREASQLQAGQRLKGMLERVDEALPAPRCPKCDRLMTRQGRRSKMLDTRSGAAAVSRRYWCCRVCRTGCYPSAQRLGLAGCGYTPGMARMTATAVQDRSFDSAARALQELSGISVISRTLARRTHKIGEEIQAFERTEVIESAPASGRLYLSIDGTGVPMRASETAGRSGRQADGSARTREAKPATSYTADRYDPKTGDVRKNDDCQTFNCRIDSAAAPGDGERSDFVQRLDRDARRYGLYKARELVVISDAARWIVSSCRALFSSRKVTYILDIHHALEYLTAALKDMDLPADERRRQFARFKAQLQTGRVRDVIAELERHPGPAVRECCRYYRANQWRMRYDEYRRRAVPSGSGVVESGCKQVTAARMKRAGCHWSKAGADAMPVLRCCLMNRQFTDFLDQRARQAATA